MNILMVCLGNICRSPLAEGVLRSKLDKNNITDVRVDSAGTSAYHEGEAPDKRMIQTAKSKGIDISNLRSRPFRVTDFDDFDFIYVMDESNYVTVSKLARTKDDLSKVHYLLENLNKGKQSVPDPYFGREKGFYEVFDLVDRACETLVSKLNKTL